MSEKPLYSIVCRDCAYTSRRIESLSYALGLRDKHHVHYPAHRVRITFDLVDVLLDETVGRQDLERR